MGVVEQGRSIKRKMELDPRASIGRGMQPGLYEYFKDLLNKEEHASTSLSQGIHLSQLATPGGDVFQSLAAGALSALGGPLPHSELLSDFSWPPEPPGPKRL